MAEKILNIIMYVLAILLMVAFVAGVIYAWSAHNKDEAIKNEIIEHLKSDTEDEGDYVILLQQCTASRVEEFPNAKWYYAWMLDDDEDTTVKIVRYVSPDDISAYTVDWAEGR